MHCAGGPPSVVVHGLPLHPGAPAALIIRLNAPAVFFDDLLHDGQAEARPLGFARDIGIEHGADQIPLESRSVVGDGTARFATAMRRVRQRRKA